MYALCMLQVRFEIPGAARALRPQDCSCPILDAPHYAGTETPSILRQKSYLQLLGNSEASVGICAWRGLGLEIIVYT